MSTLSPQAQAIVNAFGTQPGVSHDHASNLLAIIKASPVLTDQINDAVAQGHLKQIVPLTNPNAGGEYDGTNKRIRLPLAKLTTPPPGQTFDAGEMTFVLGHELQHGFNHAAALQAYRDFMKDASQAAKTDHDYTDEIGKLLAADRRDEAAAEIAGWNAIVSRVKTSKPNATIQDIFKEQTMRMSDFIDVNKAGKTPYTIKPNLALNSDLTISQTPANIEAMGQNYFDKQAKALGGKVGLGHHGNSDYVNYYATWPISEAAKLERQHNPQPSITVNLSKLRLSEQLLEENGINLCKNQQPMPYLDTGANPPKPGLFQHTATSHQHTLPISAQAFEAELARSSGDNQHDRQNVPVTPSSPGRRPTPADPDHPDHALLEKMRAGVLRMDKAAGKIWDEASERLAASALVLAKRQGFTARDDLQLAFNEPNQKYAAGELMHLSREGPTASPDPAANRVYMTTADALSAPAEERYRQVEAISQTQAQAMQWSHQQAIGPDDPSRGGPVMRM